MEITRPTIMEIDLNSLNYNIQEIKKYINNTNIMPVIKANAYGTYINYNNDFLNNFDIVAVALVDEAIELRKNGFKKEIFVLNQPYKKEIDKIIKYNITIGISEDSFIEELKKYNQEIKVHLEIDTGMGRTGINPDNTKEIIKKIIAKPNIKIEGIYTHLSSADTDFSYTNEQINKFNTSIEIAKEILKDIKYIHASASNGIINFKNANYNLVRVGLIMYGYESFEGVKEKINIKPITKLKSKITFLKEVPENTSISYSRTFITKRKSKIATIPIGYADGLSRNLSNVGEVIVNNKKCKIIGNICMDSLMIDVTDIENVKVGDDVYFWDNEIIKVEEIAKQTNTINYEVLSTISNRIPRINIK